MGGKTRFLISNYAVTRKTIIEKDRAFNLITSGKKETVVLKLDSDDFFRLNILIDKF